MVNKVNISKTVIDNYKNNKEMLNGLKLRIVSGSCSIYDMVLYDALVGTNEEDKTMKLTSKKGA